MHPAAGALGALGLGYANGQVRIVDACANLSAFLGLRPDAVGDDAHLGQIHALAGGADGGVLRRQSDVGFQRLADTLVGTRLFQNAVDVLTQLHDHVPLFHGGVFQRVLGEAFRHLVQQDIPGVITGAMRHGLPDLVAGEGQDGGEQLRHGVQNQEQSALGGAAAQAVLFLAVETILDDVQIEGGQLHNAEIVDGVGHHMELVVVVSLAADLHQRVQTGQRPAIQLLHVLGGNQIVGVELV